MLIRPLDTTAESAVTLLIHYSFELGGYTAGELIDRWLNGYPDNWVCLAVIEALYQGRYKAISVEQILAFWQRRGQASYHFNHEFERLVCGNFPQLAEQPYARANSSPLLPKEANYFSNEDDASAVAMAEKDVGKKTPAQLVDATAKVPILTKSFSKEPAQHYHQISDNDQKSRGKRAQTTSHWHSSASHLPIEQFTPEKTDTSDFYTKLKAIVQQPEN